MKLIKLENLTPEHLKAASNPRELTPVEKAELVALYKAQFTADDLQKYTELDEGIPMEDFMSELEDDLKKRQVA